MTIAGVFVGGRSRRMGGFPKGLLVHGDGTTLLDRTVTLVRAEGVVPLLVGRGDEYPAVAPSLPDAAADRGPLGGLVALLELVRSGDAVALACDMPHLTRALLARLLAHPSRAPAVAAKRGGRWEPLFARYDAGRVAPVARARLARGELSLRGLLDEIGAHELPLLPGEDMLLDDWDSPEDIA